EDDYVGVPARPALEQAFSVAHHLHLMPAIRGPGGLSRQLLIQVRQKDTHAAKSPHLDDRRTWYFRLGLRSKFPPTRGSRGVTRRLWRSLPRRSCRTDAGETGQMF